MVVLSGRFLQSWAIAIAEMAAPRAAKRKPPKLVLRLARNSPLVKYDHDVVMPQPGQRIPKIILIEQGGRPSC